MVKLSVSLRGRSLRGGSRLDGHPREGKGGSELLKAQLSQIPDQDAKRGKEGAGLFPPVEPQP